MLTLAKILFKKNGAGKTIFLPQKSEIIYFILHNNQKLKMD